MLKGTARLLFAFDGRTGRTGFWLGLLLVLAVALAVHLGVVRVFGATGAPTLAFVLLSFPLYFALLWPLAALGAKRFHDRGRPGWLSVVALGPPYLLTIADALDLSGTGESATWLGSVLSWAALLCVLWAVIELGLMPGDPDPNRFGPPPGHLSE